MIRTKKTLFALIATMFSIGMQAQVNLTQGLRMYLPFTGNATDASGNGNVATVNGATLIADRFGTANAAYHFDGINDYISLVNGPGMKPQYPFSFSCWVKLISVGNGTTNGIFYNDYVVPGTNFNGAIYTLGTNYWNASVGDGGPVGPSSRRSIFSNQTIGTGTWVHLAAIISGPTNMKIYLNCTEIPGNYSGSGSGLVYSQSGQGMIGRANNGINENYINADLDELRFYDRLLTEDEIDALYYYPNPPGTDITLGNNIQYLCPNGSLTLTPSPQGPVVDQWSDGSAGSSLTVNCPGQYWVQVTDACGVSTYDTVDVQMAPALQQVNLGPNQTICPGGTVQLNATVNGATGYLWTPGNTTQPTLTAGAGTYNVTVSNQCYTSTDAVTITASNPAGQVQASADTETCYNTPITLTATAPQGVTLLWSNGTLGAQTSISNPGVYWVNAIDQCGVTTDTVYVDLGVGCPDSTTAIIENFSTDAKRLKDYYVNDVWVITNLPANNLIMVYDAKGSLVYTTANYTNSWRPNVTEGIYYYVLMSNNMPVANGRLLIVRQ